jgi:teichuronic acid exporter
MTDLRVRAINATFWSLLDAIGVRLVQFVIGIVLARLLLPEQFGLIGMLTIFMAVSQTFLSSGFGSALIQKKEVARADASSVFYYNVVVSLALAGVLCLTAPWIAAFYRQPLLTQLTQAMSLVIVINSFVVVQTAMLIRNVDFKTQTKINLIAGTCSGLIGVAMAYRGFGVWSLVAQQVSEALFRAALFWLFNRWRPALVFSFRSLHQMFTFGSRVLASALLDQVFSKIYYVIIGRLFSVATLGFYTRASSLVDLPSVTLTSIVTRVSFPVFSSIQTENERLTRGLRRALTMLVFVNSPLMIGLAVVAKPLVQVLLTERWLPSVPYIQLLCIVGLLLPLQTLNLNVITAIGRSDLVLRLELIKKALLVLIMVIVWRWGIMALIWGYIGVSCLGYLFNSYYTGRILGYNALKQMRDIAVYFMFSAVVGTAVYLLGILEFPNDLLRLLSQICAGLVLYPLLCGMFRLPAFVTAWEIVGRKLPRFHHAVAEFKRIVLTRRPKVL